jgi:hypothetical protein
VQTTKREEKRVKQNTVCFKNAERITWNMVSASLGRKVGT